MKKILLLLSLLLSINSFSQNLPHYLTNEEKELLKTYNPPTEKLGWVTPPTKSVRTMAEWEELEGVLITWTSYTSILRQIVDYAQEEGLVYIVCSDSNSVKTYLQSGGVPLVNLKFIIASYNSVWCRDYGPWYVYSDIADSAYIIDWIYNRPRPLDDLIPGIVANLKNIPLYQMTQSPYNFTATGGNFMTDGNGTGFSSKLILTENSSKTEAEIDTMMKKFMGIKRYIKFETLPYDQIHHIDMHMKLLDEETILVGQYPAGVADGPQIEANLQYLLNNFQTCYSKPYKVVRIPMPPDAQGRYPNNSGDYRTFTNSLIMNKTVIVPTYEVRYDTTALRIYREAMPGYNVVGINSNSIITALGAIHCITKELGVNEPIFISHSAIRSVVSTNNPFEVKAFIKTRTGISNAKLFWSVDTSQGFNQILMTQIQPDTFAANIPVQSNGVKVFYYITAQSNSGRVVKKPLTAPKGSYQFIVDGYVPAELVSFYAIQNGNKIELKWLTTSEKNNRGFEIQKFFNDWKTIGFINGNGTTTEISNYKYCDDKPVKGKNIYRLKQIDFNGTSTISDIVEVSFTPLQFALEQNYPNPFNPVTVIKYSIPVKQFVELKIFNVLGNEIAKLVSEEKDAGSYSVSFNAADFSSGVYYYKLTSGSFTSSKKMVLIK